MVLKPRNTPLTLHRLEALMKRLSPHHPKHALIEDEYAKHAAGYRGEQQLDYFLAPFIRKDIHILHDIRLELDNRYFQMDTLILTPQFLLILEVKNLVGSLTFDHQFQQLLRKVDEKEDVFPDPLIQVKRQESFLSEWLTRHNIPSIPITTLIVIANPKTKIQANEQHQEAIKKITHAANVPNKLLHLQQHYSQLALSNQLCEQLADLLLKNNQPYDQPILPLYQLKQEDLITGVYCPYCQARPMNRLHGRWECPVCSAISHNAHKSAIRDYALLIDPTTSNCKLRTFLHLTSRFTTKRLLQSVRATQTGTNKGSTYDLSNLIIAHKTSVRS
ncbi:hypothetical protein AB685_22335 [Bacillus sp. LL01]|uniref:nuclease-related domain-containing protein n=1 Tax=Bacillus sp. LL01 TaxID=1665556 RepID=UPI00064D5A9E|nr:nuclease-related domain-containing protein [Bacillus sp. LL01]KMJ56373.1 hypothetical protein AB685_22335 [Bacillus sp. LL01]